MNDPAERYPVARPSLSQLEERYVVDALRSGWISSQGPYLAEFEHRFAQRCAAGQAVATSNGTVALHLVLAAAGIGPGDEVIVPALTYVATANAVAYCGARAVCVDVRRETWCVDPAAVRAAIGPRTRAVIAVDLYGHPADYPALRELCRRHGLLLVADAAESFGATLDGRPTGSLADATTFSFFGNKVITSGEGGCVTTCDPTLAQRMRLLRNQGMDPDRRYYFPVLGYNYRMTNLCAALLCAQLDRADEIIARREWVIAAYEEQLADEPKLSAQPVAPGVRRGPWMAAFLVGARADATSRDALARVLDRLGVQTRPFFVPIPDLPAHHDPTVDRPVADDLSRRGINLPTYVELTESAVKTVVERVRAALGAIG
ncbi:DegT/DnrJ/EryC1/StrS family aminotransferase [Micromonospora sp. NBC_01813]|uniref:DegT/DnrJ/EryC1/StrS family aminotransferase n=1 Tax=Micromonospora sp. NBC_01813 TaxID=2975988 RepID=UPI002DDC7878|nr:DegT/DnrJ/EryC1/StrS family aminotransferase [Micromonospora sp. NBC_01813]WSA06395.1 DegT/DnrJ/EryC1/StrS family aminotransferase [Micromonospora sp. NBC_01813]